jgi:beta-glucuronidase
MKKNYYTHFCTCILVLFYLGLHQPTFGQNSVRRTKELSSGWKFLMDVRNIGEKEKWFADKNIWTNASQVVVPRAWDLIETGMWQYEGVGWYKTSIRPEDFISGKRTELLFNRVMYYSKVWLNGEYLGENIGGYLPFKFNITDKLRKGQENNLILRIDNKARIEWLPAAGQVEWIQYGGILQPVEIINTAQSYVEDFTVKTTPENGGAKISCIANVVNDYSGFQDLELEVEISGSTGKSIQSQKFNIGSGENKKVDLDLFLHKAELWSPDKPALYKATVRLKNKGSVIDDHSEKIGIREIKTQGQKILLNGHQFIVKGVNRYDEYDSFGPNPPEDLLRKELALMKKTGINTIRVHYPQSPQLLSLYDEYGFVMLEEVPLNWWGLKFFKEEVKQTTDILPQAKEALTKIIKRDKNHPCVIIWSMGNECETTNEVGTTVMRELLKLGRSLDQTRLLTYVSNSEPGENPAYADADVVCVNMYHGSLQGKVCNHIGEIDSLGYYPLVNALKRFSKVYPDKPIFLTEFGTQGVKNIHGDINHSEEFQAAYIERIWQGIRSVPNCSGGVLWSWADYYHRKYLVTYAAYGPYGVVTVDRKPKKSLEALTRMYQH